MRRPPLICFVILLGCSGTVTPPPQDQSCSNLVRSVTVTPASATLSIGDTVRLKYLDGGNCGQPPVQFPAIWSSSNTAAATVDSAGLVRALGPGPTVTVTAAAKADPTVKGAALITVLSLNGTATVMINSITTVPAGVPANLASLAGAVDVTVGVSAALPVDLVINNGTRDTVVAAGQSVSNGTNQTPATLRWNTAAQAAGGARVFPNGAYVVRANVHAPNSTTVVSSGVSVTLNNP
jgi:hypothetical protein